MKKGDMIWLMVLMVCIALFVFPVTQVWILSTSQAHPYLAGFTKFMILASMGDILGKRIVTNRYELSKATLIRGLVWGSIGLMVTLVFPVFMGGASLAQADKLLPFFEVPLAQAFFGSTLMNLTFAPAMNTYHRILDLWIDAKMQKQSLSLKELIAQIDWVNFVTFNWLKVGILFWIPVHTMVFLLPADLRVAVAAFSSIALGVILSFAAKKSSPIDPVSNEQI